ncbi:hypothetical protein LTR36_001206 [Oleoguttula mirabilis]|uniref:Uncharacterized protein n=1 Tax=Oleoguttula mirabilis TaxID=1507867 RepID=A0AAV9J2S8_9PEZI|nr:hypothetical protein LTR36_001206 [Oleoguttula mirabilis]
MEQQLITEALGATLSSHLPAQAFAMPAPETDREIFPFFNLPHELRNWIYRNAVLENAHVGGYAHAQPKIVATPFPIPQLRLVSRQFKSEYEEEVFRYVKVVAMDLLLPCTDLSGVVKSSKLSTAGLTDRVQVLTLRLEVRYFAGGVGFRGSVEAARRQAGQVVAHFPALRKLELILCGPVEEFEECVETGRFDIQSFFTLDLHEQADASGSLTIKRTLLLRGKLWTTRNRGIEILAVANKLEFGSKNDIIYRATATSDSSSWHGLELETAAAGNWNYDEVFKGHQAKLASRNEGYSVTRPRWLDNQDGASSQV